MGLSNAEKQAHWRAKRNAEMERLRKENEQLRAQLCQLIGSLVSSVRVARKSDEAVWLRQIAVAALSDFRDVTLPISALLERPPA
jgi:hypothetical protein